MIKLIIFCLLFSITTTQLLANEHAEFEKSLLSIWVTTLKEYESTQNEYQFMQRRGTPIIFLNEENPKMSGLMALYEDETIYVNRTTLLDMVQELKRRGGAMDEEIPEVIALKTVSFIGHELVHGINSEKLEQAGVFYPGGLQEDEVVAYQKQLEIFKEVEYYNSLLYLGIFGLELEFADDTYRDLKSSHRQGLSGMQNFVIGRGYGSGSILDLDKFEERLNYNIEVITKSISKVQNLIAKLEASDNVTTPETQERLQLLYETKSRFVAKLELFKPQLTLIRDPIKSKILREYYVARLLEQGFDL